MKYPNIFCKKAQINPILSFLLSVFYNFSVTLQLIHIYIIYKYAILQSFPPDYVFIDNEHPSNRREIGIHIGNAPVPHAAVQSPEPDEPQSCQTEGCRWP